MKVQSGSKFLVPHEGTVWETKQLNIYGYWVCRLVRPVCNNSECPLSTFREFTESEILGNLIVTSSHQATQTLPALKPTQDLQEIELELLAYLRARLDQKGIPLVHKRAVLRAIQSALKEETDAIDAVFGEV